MDTFSDMIDSDRERVRHALSNFRLVFIPQRGFNFEVDGFCPDISSKLSRTAYRHSAGTYNLRREILTGHHMVDLD